MPEPPRKRTDLDDWLGGDDDWADTSEQTGQIPRQSARPPVPGDEFDDDEFDIREELYRRRRMIALGAIGLGVVILIVVLVVVFGGGGSSKKTTTSTPAVNTTPIDTTPINTTPTTPTTTTTPTTPTNVTEVTLPASGKLQKGDSGDQVKALQNALIALELDPGTADGSFGPSTETAVIAFQKAHNLDQDGVVGQKTADEINAALAANG